MNLFSAKLHRTGPKAHIRVESVIPFNKIGATPQVFAYLVYPNGKELLVDEGEPIGKLAAVIASRKSAYIPHVGFTIRVKTVGDLVEIGWGINKDSIGDLYAYDAESLLEQIAPQLVNQYLKLR